MNNTPQTTPTIRINPCMVNNKEFSIKATATLKYLDIIAPMI